MSTFRSRPLLAAVSVSMNETECVLWCFWLNVTQKHSLSIHAKLFIWKKRNIKKGIWGFVMFSVSNPQGPHTAHFVYFTWMYSYLTSAPFGLSYDVNAFFVLTKNISECRPVPWWPPGFHSGSSSLEHWRWSPRSCHGPSCSPAGTNMSVRLGHLWSTGGATELNEQGSMGSRTSFISLFFDVSEWESASL